MTKVTTVTITITMMGTITASVPGRSSVISHHQCQVPSVSVSAWASPTTRFSKGVTRLLSGPPGRPLEMPLGMGKMEHRH